MNFEILRSKMGLYESGDAHDGVGASLKTIVDKHGLGVFKNTGLLFSEIEALPLPPATRAQLRLIFCGSHLGDFLFNAKSELNLVDVDNAIHNVVNTSGLSYRLALKLVTDVFFACGLNFAVEYGPVLQEDAVEERLHALMPNQWIQTELAEAERLMAAYQHKFLGTYQKYRDPKTSADEKKNIESQNRANAAKAVGAIRRLCGAGAPKAFYLLGRCYFYEECGTERDISKARELLNLASERGVPEAAAVLGDIHYLSDDPLLRDYTLAHHYYSRPGAMAMGRRQQDAIQDIYRQSAANKTTLLFGGVLFALTILFVSLFHQGLFSDASRLVPGVILTAISALTFAAGIFYHFTLKKYNGIRALVAVQYMIWAVYACILLLA